MIPQSNMKCKSFTLDSEECHFPDNLPEGKQIAPTRETSNVSKTWIPRTADDAKFVTAHVFSLRGYKPVPTAFALRSACYLTQPLDFAP